jgi:hypothetical protein
MRDHVETSDKSGVRATLGTRPALALSGGPLGFTRAGARVLRNGGMDPSIYLETDLPALGLPAVRHRLQRENGPPLRSLG